MKTLLQKSDLIVFSLNRWNSSFERTEQLISKFAHYRRVYFFEVPVMGFSESPRYLIRETRDDVKVVEPYLPSEMSVFDQKEALIKLLMDLVANEKISEYSVWTDTPKAMPLIRSLDPKALIYDCQEDYAETNPELERELFTMSDLVFTAGSSLYAAKKSLHKNIHHYPDSIDYRHFYQARLNLEEPVELQGIPHPRIGFAGAIDQNIDLDLLENLACMKPDWHFVIAGSVTGIEREKLPRLENIHFLPQVSYVKLPQFLSHLDSVFLPYKITKETKYLNPSLINQALVAGVPVVSTSVQDVIDYVTAHGLVTIADFPLNLTVEIEKALNLKVSDSTWLEAVDKSYRGMSWDLTAGRMNELEHDIYTLRQPFVEEIRFFNRVTGNLMDKMNQVTGYGPRMAFYRK